MAAVQITEYTDPGCPFAFSAEPIRWRLNWLYGDQIEWKLRMVVLAEAAQEYLDKGFTVEMMASGTEHLAREHGMPMDTRVRPRMAGTAPACLAVVAARLHAPELERPLLRRFRVRQFEGGFLDDPAMIADAAVDVGLDPAQLTAWMDEPAVREAFEADKAAARNPTPAALAQAHKLAKWEGGMRYTCPSYEITGPAGTLSVPGFQPWAAYEVALANVAPDLLRKDAPADVTELLRWAGVPLASKEVAVVMDTDVFTARAALGLVATEHHVGADGYGSLTD
jgi:predicted DsbA family dithiol-disulfide isomerase